MPSVTIGCFFSGDSYGTPSSLPWAVALPRGAPPSTAGALRTEFGISIPASVPDGALVRVHLTMLYSALTLLAVFGLLWWLRKRAFPTGTLFGLYLLLSGVERFLVELLRAKDDRFLLGFTTAQAIAVMAVVGGALLLLRVARRINRPSERRTTRGTGRPGGRIRGTGVIARHRLGGGGEVRYNARPQGLLAHALASGDLPLAWLAAPRPDRR